MNLSFLNFFEKDYPEDVAFIRERGYGIKTLRNKMIENKDYSNAIDFSKKHLENNKRLAINYTLLADTYEQCNDIPSAISTYEKALKIGIKNTAHMYISYAKLSEKHYERDKIIEIYSSYVEKNTYLPIHRNFINYLLSIGELDRVEKECKKVDKRHKNKTQNLTLILSEVYIKRGELKKAKEALLYLTEKNKNNGAAWKMLNEVERKIALDEYDNQNIVREIEFSPEHHAAGIAILQNFGKLLRDKYNKTPVKITIAQNDLTVKMIVIPPNGKKLEVEEYLSNYGLVVKGKMNVEEFLNDPRQIMELKTELRLAHTRIEIQREQMAFINNQHQSQINSLEEQVTWLRNQVGDSLLSQKNNYNDLLKLLKNTNKNNQKNIEKITSAIEKKDINELKSVISILESDEPKDYSRLKDFISNAISSTGANAPTWIEFISKALPI